MIESITIDFTNYFDRCPWGVVYYGEAGSVLDSDYCDDATECISSLEAHKEDFSVTCNAGYLVPAVAYGVDALVSTMEEVNAYLKELGIAE